MRDGLARQGEIAMVASGVTMPVMTDDRKKPKKKMGRPATGRTPSTAVFARVSPELGKALDAYVESIRPRTTNTAVVSLALEEYLTRAGFWPPPSKNQP